MVVVLVAPCPTDGTWWCTSSDHQNEPPSDEPRIGKTLPGAVYFQFSNYIVMNAVTAAEIVEPGSRFLFLVGAGRVQTNLP